VLSNPDTAAEGAADRSTVMEKMTGNMIALNRPMLSAA